MKPKLLNRFTAHLIDIGVVFLIIKIIGFFNNNSLIKTINNKINLLNEQFFNKEITFNKYLIDFSKNIYQLDKNQFLFYLIVIVVIFLYFVIIPYFTNGKTLGLKLFNLKIKGASKLKNLIKRSIIINGLLFILIPIIFVHIFKDLYYFILIIMFSIVQMYLIIKSIIMIITSEDQLGLHDKFSKTKIEVKE